VVLDAITSQQWWTLQAASKHGHQFPLAMLLDQPYGVFLELQDEIRKAY
jgi:hypothetical protein